MKYVDRIMLARAFMGSPCVGEHECVSCGISDRATQKIKKSVKNTFCNFDELMIGKGDYLCDSCCGIMEDPDMRFRAVFFCSPGEKQIPDRVDILQIIKNPPEEFVLSLPYSNKKHHWLFAGMSDTHLALIGTDNRTIALDYDRYNISDVIDTVFDMIRGGVPRAEIISGKYSVSSRYKVPDLDRYEFRIAPLRETGAVEMFVRYTPAVKDKIILEGEAPMLTQTEQDASEILCSIAARSQYRMVNGISFWGGFFERRINRFKSLELHEFVSRLCASVGTQMMFTEKLEVLENEDQVMNEIRNKTNLIVALAYTTIKKNKECR